jgi:hypothetical protein
MVKQGCCRRLWVYLRMMILGEKAVIDNCQQAAATPVLEAAVVCVGVILFAL